MAASDLTSQLKRKRALERHFAADFSTLTYPLLAHTYYQEGDMVRARKVCGIGLKYRPEHAPGLFLLAMVNMREGQMEEAEQLLDRTLAQDPYHVEAAEYFVAVQERLKRPPGVLERAYKILLLANPLSHSAQVRLKRMQAEKELVLKVKREMRLREAAVREPIRVGGRESVGELRPLPEVERPAKVTGAAESEPALFVPTARLPEEPPLDILSDEEAERAERIEARLEESEQLTEAERAWERHIKEVAAELAQGEQVPEAIAEPESTRFPLEDYGTGESEPTVATPAPDVEPPPDLWPGEEEDDLPAGEDALGEPLPAGLRPGRAMEEEAEPEPGSEEEQAEALPAEGTISTDEPAAIEPAAAGEEAVTAAQEEESLIAAETAVEEAPEPLDEQLWPGEGEGGAANLEPWPETTAAAEIAGESTGADSAEITPEATPTVVDEPTLKTEPEEEIAAAAEPPEIEAAGDEREPDFLEELPPGEEPETAKVAPEGGEEEEDAWATYLKPENVLGDDSLTVEAEISVEGKAPSVAAKLGDLERELTIEMDAGETEPVPVEPEPVAEPEIEPTLQPEQPGVPADEEPPGLSIAARLAQLRMELSAKYAPGESSPPAVPKAESKPEAEVTLPSSEVQGEEDDGDTEVDPVAEVEAEIKAAGVALEAEVSPPETAAEAGKPPTDKPLPIADRLALLRKEIAQGGTSEEVAGPEPEASAMDIEVEAEPAPEAVTDELPATEVTIEPEIEGEVATIDESAEVPPVEPEPEPIALDIEPEPAEVTEEADTTTAAPPAEPQGPEPVAEMAAEMEAADEAAEDQPAPIEPPEVAEELAEEQPTAESIIEEDRPAGDEQPAEEVSEPPAERSSGPTDTMTATFVDPKLATFTLADIYQVQGLYQQALQVLDILENKGGDPARIKRERATITAAMSAGSKSE